MPKNTPPRKIDLRPVATSGVIVASGGGTGGGGGTGVPVTRTLTAGNGLTGGGTLAADRTFAVGAGDGISVSADAVALASSVAGAGLTIAAGVLAVGAGALITVGADTVGITAGANYQFVGTGSGTAAGWRNVSELAGAGLTAATGVLSVGAGAGLTVNADDVALTTPGSLSVSSSNSASGSHTHAVTASADVSAGTAALLKSTATGGLALASLTSPSLLATANLTVQPTGDLILDPVGNDVLPLSNYDINLGALSKKYLTLHAAELWVETLVAQNTIATIGGRVLVAPTNILTADLGSGVGDTTITVKYNNLVNGDRVYMEANGALEWMAITSGAGGSAGAYTYSVTRDLDGSGRNAWYAGDAILDTGQAGNGFIDLYSLYGIPRAGQTSTQRAGPTIVGNVRISATYNDLRERWAIGNLNGLYDYASNLFGFAAGNPDTAWVSADASSGFRIMSGSTVRLQAAANGNLRLNNSSGTNVIALDSDGSSYFAGPMTIGLSGGIYQGSGTFASPTTGLKVWNDSGIGRIAGYSGGNLEWGMATDGEIVFAQDKMRFHRDGFAIKRSTTVATSNDYAICWWDDPSPSGRAGTLRARLYMMQEDSAPIRNAGVILAGGTNYGAMLQSDNGYVLCTGTGSGGKDVVIGGRTAMEGDVDISGMLAIGKSSPATALDVFSGADGQLAQFIVNDGSDSVGFALYGYTNDYGTTYLQDTMLFYATASTPNLELAAPHASGVIRFNTGGYSSDVSERLRITNTGAIFDGDSGTLYRFQSEGSDKLSIGYSANGQFVSIPNDPLKFSEQSAIYVGPGDGTPAATHSLTNGAECCLYMRDDKLIVAYRDTGGVYRYYYISLTGNVSTQWIYTGTRPGD